MNPRYVSSSLTAAKIGIAITLFMASVVSARADGLGTTPAPPSGSAPPITTSATGSPRLRYRIVVDQDATQEAQYQQWNLPVEVGVGLQSQLVDKLQKSGYFIVLERQASATNQEINEDNVAANQRANLPPRAVAPPPRQQRIAGDYVITPSLIGYVTTGGNNNGMSFGGISLGGQKSETTVTLNIRISNSQTSEVLDTQTAIGKAHSKSGGVGLNFGAANFNNQQFQNSPAGQAVDQALDDAVNQIITRLSQEPWTAKVAAQDPNTNRVIINAGDLSGVAAGMIFNVYRAGQPVLDPDTGAVISQGDDVKIGQIKVARVEHDASYCDILAGKQFAPHDVVKPAN